MVEIVRNIPEKEWKTFLEDYSEATLYHTPAWKIFLERTFDYKPHYLFATDDCGSLMGLLPLFHIQSRLTGNRLCSVPFAHECGCLGDPATCSALIKETMEIKRQHDVDTIEIRNFTGHPDFQEANTFCTHLLALSQNPNEVWKQLDKGSVRWAIKKSEKLGVTVTTSKNIEDLKEFYELNRITKQHFGVPCHPWKFFENLFSDVGEYVHLYLSRHENKIIAGGIMECFKDHILYGYGAADPRTLHLHPYHTFIWKSIQDACVQGYRFCDFGRTSYENTGLIQFKKQWGTREKKLVYSVFPGSSTSFLSNRESTLYRLGNAVIRQMPMPVYTKFSDVVFQHLG